MNSMNSSALDELKCTFNFKCYICRQDIFENINTMNTEIQSIIDHSLEYAKELLSQTGELHPFGAFTDKVGQVHPLEMEIDKKSIPTNGKIIETLWNFCMEEMDNDRITAFGVAMESSIQIEEGKDPIDALVLIANHKNDEDLPAYCTPFTISGESKVEYGEMFAVDKKFFN